MQAHRHHKDRPCPSPGRTTGTATPHTPSARAADVCLPQGPEDPLPPSPRDQAGTPTACHQSNTIQTVEVRGPCPMITKCYRRIDTMARTGGRQARPPTWARQRALEGLQREGGAGLLRSLIQGVPANNCGMCFHPSTGEGQQLEHTHPAGRCDLKWAWDTSGAVRETGCLGTEDTASLTRVF